MLQVKFILQEWKLLIKFSTLSQKLEIEREKIGLLYFLTNATDLYEANPQNRAD